MKWAARGKQAPALLFSVLTRAWWFVFMTASFFFFWHCSGPIELALPTVGLAVSGQEVPRARSVRAHTLTHTHTCIL